MLITIQKLSTNVAKLYERIPLKNVYFNHKILYNQLFTSTKELPPSEILSIQLMHTYVKELN